MNRIDSFYAGISCLTGACFLYKKLSADFSAESFYVSKVI
jgi:hypothetical protein